MLNVELKKDYLENEKLEEILSERTIHLKEYEDRNLILIAGKKKEVNSVFVLFEYLNETVAYDYLHQDPLYLLGLVDNWEIKEVEILSRKDTKDLSRVFTYLV